MAEDKQDPTTTSLSHRRMKPKWRKMETLLGGTDAMREAGVLYAPKHEYETQKNYDARINATTLLNMVEQTLDALSGKPFSDPVVVSEDTPELIRNTIIQDVDLQGNNIDVFSRSWFREGVAKAFAHVLVDSPKPIERADGQPRTLEDDRIDGIRPYWVLIKPENVLFAHAEYINGVETLTHVRILEEQVEQDGFTETPKRSVRILEPGKVEIWEPESGNKKAKWVKVDEWETGLPTIPLVTYYADRSGLMEGKPPLNDLADKNIEHWASSSEQRNVLTVARFPILGGSGVSHDKDNPLVLGPRRSLTDSNPDSKYYYIEHSGAAIEAGRKDLQDIEAQMAGYGAEFLKKRPGNETATARALDSAEASSDLSAMAGMFEDAVAQALQITADWMGIKASGGRISVVKDFGTDDNSAGLELLSKARDRRDISRRTLLETFRIHGILPDDFDADKDLAEIANEPPSIFGGSESNIDAGQ
jgi:uncharacterized protein DUF4055